MKWLFHTTTIIINTIGNCVVAIHINSAVDLLLTPYRHHGKHATYIVSSNAYALTYANIATGTCVVRKS